MRDQEFDALSRGFTKSHARSHRAQGIDRVQTTIWLEPQDHSHLKTFSEMAGIPMAQVVEKMIRREVRKRARKSGITPPISL